jgi:transcriptional regulator with XRE-family HTH domain
MQIPKWVIVKSRTLSEQLRASLDQAPVSRYRVAKQTGIEQAALSRFMAGKRSLSLPSAEKLAEFLGLTLLPAEHTNRRVVRSSR